MMAKYTTKAPLEAYPSRPPLGIPISRGGGAQVATSKKVSGNPVLLAGGSNVRGIEEERFERAEAIRVKANREATRRLPERPPEGFRNPFDPEFKAQFQQNLYAYIEERYGIPGGNPFKMDIMGMVERISADRLPKIWVNFTGRKVLWEDREGVKEYNPKAWKAWLQVINQDRSRISTSLKTRRADAIRDYEDEMGKLDTKIKIARANFVEQRKLREEARKPPATDLVWNKDKKVMEIWQWDSALQKMFNTEKIGKEPKEKKPPSDIAKEKFAISKKITAGERRTGLIESKGDKNVYEANVSIFNTTNSRNEVAYWDIRPGKVYGTNEETKIIKIPESLIKKELTPNIIQQQANNSGKTIAEVLKDLGIIR